MILLVLALLQQDPGLARAESLLVVRDLPAARALAEQTAQRDPRNARVHLLLGRVWLAWPAFGRYQALEEFRTAARLAPEDPEPLYWQVEVGDRLGSDEGEVLVREAVLRIFALTPDYRDCWLRFQSVFHNRDIWRRADAALGHHPDDPLALERRAELAIALDQPDRGDSLAALVLAKARRSVSAYLLRAQAHFDAGHLAGGYAWYDSALAHADLDSAGVLWDQVWMIASPGEAARHDSTPPEERRRFFAWFWGRRDPNLVTRENERIAEHFNRLARSRREFRLLHPQSLYQRSAVYRTVVEHDQRYSMRDLPSTPSLTLSYLAGLDARGLIFIRHGPPDVRVIGTLDAERGDPSRAPFWTTMEGWLYNTPEGILSLGFGRVRGAGDFTFTPVKRRQAESTRQLLTTDRTALPARLDVHGWSASFAGDELGMADAYFVVRPGTAAAVLWTRDGEEVVRATGAGLLRLTIPPGTYALGLDADSAGVVGRVRREIQVPRYSIAMPGLSSLALAPGDSLVGREPVLAAMPADLVYPAGLPLTAYAELYGLTRDAAGLVRYVVRYSFAPVRSLPGRALGAGSPVVLEFTRERSASPVVPERLVIEPGRVRPGRYRVTLSVTDIPTNVKSQTVTLEITIR